jgi:hypothetical protein
LPVREANVLSSIASHTPEASCVALFSPFTIATILFASVLLLASAATVRARLEQLEKDATAKGFLLIARKAAAAAK